MAQLTWAADVPSGILKNHKLSSQIRMAATAESKFVQFFPVDEQYGKNSGDTLNITLISNITVPSSAALTEGVRISEDTMSMSSQSVTVSEYGRAVPFSSLQKDLQHFDLENAVQKNLMKQMKLSLDIAASTVAKAGQIKAIPTGVSALTFDTDGTASSAAVSNLNVYHVERIRDAMFATYLIEPIGDEYVCLASYKALRGLKDDPDWQDWHKYTDPAVKFKGEVGKIENIRFIEVNHTSALSDTKGTGSVLGECIFFGDDAFKMVVAQQPELRLKESDDYGRSKGVAWYGIFTFMQIWSSSATAGQARTIHVTSS